MSKIPADLPTHLQYNFTRIGAKNMTIDSGIGIKVKFSQYVSPPNLLFTFFYDSQPTGRLTNNELGYMVAKKLKELNYE